jgi:predicted phosphoribosyltransferase
MIELPFPDRDVAGRLLGAELASRGFAAKPNALVLALARGGLLIGAEVADALNKPLDVLVVRKLGVPWQPELAIGAIAGETHVLNYGLVRDLVISAEELEAIVARESREAKRREKLYREGLPALDFRNRIVVLTDDGLATGATMLAAARDVRRFHPQRVIVAVPVASPEACDLLRDEVDECICLAVPDTFVAVGEWYEHFPQVSDAEVQQILKRSHSRPETMR